LEVAQQIANHESPQLFIPKLLDLYSQGVAYGLDCRLDIFAMTLLLKRTFAHQIC
jgi:hypothetical protein